MKKLRQCLKLFPKFKVNHKDTIKTVNPYCSGAFIVDLLISSKLLAKFFQNFQLFTEGLNSYIHQKTRGFQILAEKGVIRGYWPEMGYYQLVMYLWVLKILNSGVAPWIYIKYILRKSLKTSMKTCGRLIQCRVSGANRRVYFMKGLQQKCFLKVYLKFRYWNFNKTASVTRWLRFIIFYFRKIVL